MGFTNTVIGRHTLDQYTSTYRIRIPLRILKLSIHATAGVYPNVKTNGFYRGSLAQGVGVRRAFDDSTVVRTSGNAVAVAM